MERHTPTRTALLIALATAAVIACAGCSDSIDPFGDPIAQIGAARVEPGPHNVTSLLVHVHASGVSGVAVQFGPDTNYGSTTATVPLVGDSAVVPVVGLQAASTYHLRVVGIGAPAAAGAVHGADVVVTTGALPVDFPAYTVTRAGHSSPGLVLFGITSGDASAGGFYAIVIDSAGRPVWYRRFDSQITDLQQQPNGHITAYSSLGSDARHYYELDALANVVGEYSAAGGRETDSHELRLVPGGYIVSGLEERPMDLQAFGGHPDALVTGAILEYHRSDGGTLVWSAFDNFRPDDAGPDIDLKAAKVNPWHLNAIDIDTDGNLLISFRNSDVIVKINSVTGAVLWRLGGRRSDFTFVGDPVGGFSHQHGVRRMPNGNLVFFDNGNGHVPQESRAVEYRLDESAHTATLVWDYHHLPPLYSSALGLAQRTADGHTLICYGTLGRVVEVDAVGAEQWTLTLTRPATFIYRAFRIPALLS